MLLRMMSSKLFLKCQGLFEVTRLVGEVNYAVRQMDGGNALQIYHLNVPRERRFLLVGVGGEVLGRKEPGPEVPIKKNSVHYTLVPIGDYLSLSQKAQVAVRGPF